MLSVFGYVVWVLRSIRASRKSRASFPFFFFFFVSVHLYIIFFIRYIFQSNVVRGIVALPRECLSIIVDCIFIVILFVPYLFFFVFFLSSVF